MISRQSNYLGQMRLDLPHLRALESSVAADFDALAGRALAGSQALVLKAFNLVTTAAIGAPASSLKVAVAGGLAFHQRATEAGTVFWVPDDRAPETLSAANSLVTGSFSASQTNFVGLDLSRSADASTSDTVQFLNPDTGLETAKTVPLARTLNYRFVVGVENFSGQPNVLPLAKVVTDANNNVVSLQDARQGMFRLGSGGDFPSITSGYSWPGGRAENLTGDVFSGGDKAVTSMKQWMDAVMTRLWEVGGGEYWYSAAADRNVTMIWTGATFTNNENFEVAGSNLHWKGLKFLFDNSTGHYNDVKDQTSDSGGLTDLADGDCVYVDLDRTQDLTGGSALQAVKVALTLLGPGSVPGARQVIAWRIGSSFYTRNWRYAVGTTFTVASTSALGVVKLSHTATTPTAPIVMSDGGINAASGFVGLDASKRAAYTSTTGIAIDVTSGAGNGAGARGTGNGSGTGVAGVGGATNGSYGLTGTSSATNGGGVTGTGSGTGAGVVGQGGSANGVGVVGTGLGSGAGVTGTASGATGSGVVGNGNTSGYGGFFAGGSSGPGVAGTGGGSAAGGIFSSPSGLAVQSTGGNIEVPAANNYTYATAVTFKQHAGPGDIQIETAATFALAFGTRENKVGFVVTGGSSKLTARFLVPRGATVTTLEINDEVTDNSTTYTSTVYATMKTASGTAYTNTALESGGSGVAYSHGAGATISRAWRTLAGVSGTVTDDGFVQVTVDVTASGGVAAWFIYGLRLTYTITTVKPIA